PRIRRGGGRARNGQSAVYAVHGGSRAAEYETRSGSAPELASPDRGVVPGRDRPLDVNWRAQRLPPTRAQHAGDAGSAPFAFRTVAAPALAEAVGFQDGRDSVPAHGRRGHDDRV